MQVSGRGERYKEKVSGWLMNCPGHYQGTASRSSECEEKTRR